MSTTTHYKEWFEIRPQGLFCVPGQFYIDPVYPVDKAVITNAHSDHARSGHQLVYATKETVEIMQLRYGLDCAQYLHILPFHQMQTIKDIDIYFLPAGHILGSAQCVLQSENHRVIISGDYKRVKDPTCLSFIPQPCDLFITEATFGLPIFNHPSIEVELNKLLESVKSFPDRCHLVGAYALGKCQRVIKTLRLMGYAEPIYLHGALVKISKYYEAQGITLGDLRLASELTREQSAGKIIMCPPSALHDRWTRRFADPIVANASGWMQIRARAKQQLIDLPLIISDHADWQELINTIKEINPKEVWVTHGLADALVYYMNQQGYKTSALTLISVEEGAQS